MLRLESVEFTVTNGDRNLSILKDINLQLKDGKFYALTGPNGGERLLWLR